MKTCLILKEYEHITVCWLVPLKCMLLSWVAIIQMLHYGARIIVRIVPGNELGV